MNQIYRVIWNRAIGKWVVASEQANSNGKSRGERAARKLAAIGGRLRRTLSDNRLPLMWLVPLALALMPLASWAQSVAANALPVGGTVSAGQATISQSGSQMNIVQSTDKVALNWQSFNIGSGAGVAFQQPGSQSVALNRVAGADPSQIFGTLTANGKVILINPNGVVFGTGSRIDASGLVATTKVLSDADFMAGNYHFSGGGSGVVRNDGTIIASPDGGVLLSADKVINTGTITVRGGTIGMVSAGDMQLASDWRSATINTATSGDVNTITVENTGKLDVSGATGGQIALQGGSGTLQSSGQILATGEQGKGGQIQLTGTQVGLMAGSLTDASGMAGGGDVLVGGDWQGSGTLQRASATYMDKDATIKANTTSQGDGGKVVLWADGYTNFNGQIQANGAGSGNGGMVETSGKDILDAYGDVQAKGVQAGQWLLDPTDVTIVASGGSGTLTGGTYNPASSGSINNTTINTALNGGTSVTISNRAGTGGVGYITQNANAPITKTAGGDATLSLLSSLAIVLNGGITSTAGKLNIVLDATNGLNDGSGSIVANTDISTNGGTLNFNSGVYVAGAGARTFKTGGGNIRFAGDMLIANLNGLLIDTTGSGVNGTATFNGKIDSGDQYDFIDTPMTWTDAAIAARNGTAGGTAVGDSFLATPLSALQNLAAASTVTSSYGAWIGGTSTSGQWRWTGGAANGVVFNTSLTGPAPASGAYTNWNAGQPDNTSGVENYLQFIGTRGLWNDLPVDGGSFYAGHLGYVRQTNLAASPLTINAGNAAVSFNGAVGSLKALASLTVTGPTAINGGRVSTEQGQTYNNPVTIGAVSTLLESTKSSLALASQISFSAGSQQSLDIRAAKNITTNAAITATSQPDTISMTAGADGLGTGTITINSPVATRGGNIILDARSGIAINGVALDTTGSFNGTISMLNRQSGDITASAGGTMNAGNNTITINNGITGGVAGTGKTSLQALTGGAITVANNVSGLAAGQNALTLNGAVNASGAVSATTMSGDVLVNQNITSTAASNVSAIIVGAATGKVAGDSSGGNVKLANGSKLAVNSNSRAIVYTGSIAGSTGVAPTDAGTPGLGNYRYNVAYNNTSRLSGSTGTYVQYREQPTLTMTLPDKVYDATALNSQNWSNYSVTGWQNGDTGSANTLSGNLSLNGSTSTVARNVGSYSVLLGTLADKLGYRLDVSGTPTYRITPAPLTVAGVAASKTYGTNDPSLTYNATGFVGGESESVLSGNIGRNSGENVGAYNQTIGSLTANNGNYTITFTPAQLTINKNTASPLIVTGGTQQKNYGGNDPVLTYTPTGFVNGSVQSYNAAGTLQTIAIADSAGNSLSGNLGRVSGENVGGYATTQGTLSSSNYAISFTPGQLNIIKDAASPLTVASNAVSKTFGTNDPGLTYVVNGLFTNRNVQSYTPSGSVQTVTINDTAPGSLSGNLGRNPGENVGTYATTQGTLSSSNYVISFTPDNLTINPASLNVVANAQSKTYGQDDPDLNYTYGTSAQANVQSYDAAGTLGTVAVAGGGTPQFAGHLGRNTGETAGQYQILQGSVSAPNYTISYTGNTLNITPANVNIVADAQTKVYGTDDPTFTYSSNNNTLVKRTVQSYDTAGNLQGTAIDDTVNGLQGSLGRQAGEGVGTYAITKGSLGSPNYNVTFTLVNLDITPASAAVTANAQVKTYGQDDPVLTYAATGLVNRTVASRDAAGDLQNIVINDAATSPFTGNLGRQAGEGAGNRTITQGSLTAANYTIGFTGNTLAIATAPVTVAANAQSKGFGTDDPTLGYIASGLVNRNAQVYNAAGQLQSVTINDTNNPSAFSGNLGRVSGESVGSYGITQGSLASSNYTLTYTPSNLAITPAVLSVVANAQTKLYGQDDPDLNYTYTGTTQANVQSYDAAGNLNTVAVAGGGSMPQFSGHLGRDVGETVAQYQIRQGSLTAANYQINYTANNLNITPTAVSIVADAKSKSFGTDDPTFTYTSNNNTLVNRTVQSYDTNGNVMLTAINDTINGLQGNLGRVSGENVGQYQIVQGNLGSPNYLLNFTPVNLDITPAAMTVAANAQSKNYGQDDPELTYSFSNSTQSSVQSRDINGNLVTVAVTGGGSSAPQFAGNLGRVSGENVGSYGITQGSLTAANYNISYTPAQLAINASTDPGAILNVAADGKTKVYGDADPTLTYQVANPSAFVNRTVRSYDANGNVVTTTIADNAGNAITGSLSRASGEDVGSYGIGQGSLASQNYLINYSANNLDILQRLLTISGLTVATRTYDTTTNAQISGGSLNGVLAADLGGVNLDGTTGNFIDKNVGTNKDVLVSNAALSGAKAHNYAVNYEQSSTTGTITPALLTVSNVSAQDKVYDGTTNATYQGDPVLTGVFASDAGKVDIPIAHVVGNFADRNAGVGKQVISNVQAAELTGVEAGNYRVNLIVADVNKATITPAKLKITGTSDTKLFDGTTSSSKTPTVAGLVGGDSVGNLRQEFDTELPSQTDTKNMMVLNGFVVNDGNGGQNYVVETVAGKGQIKGIPMGENLAGLSSSGGSSSNNFVQSSRNLELINPVGALEDIRQKAEQANYFLKANPAPAGTATQARPN